MPHRPDPTLVDTRLLQESEREKQKSFLDGVVAYLSQAGQRLAEASTTVPFSGRHVPFSPAGAVIGVLGEIGRITLPVVKGTIGAAGVGIESLIPGEQAYETALRNRPANEPFLAKLVGAQSDVPMPKYVRGAIEAIVELGLTAKIPGIGVAAGRGLKATEVASRVRLAPSSLEQASSEMRATLNTILDQKTSNLSQSVGEFIEKAPGVPSAYIRDLIEKTETGSGLEAIENAIGLLKTNEEIAAEVAARGSRIGPLVRKLLYGIERANLDWVLNAPARLTQRVLSSLMSREAVQNSQLPFVEKAGYEVDDAIAAAFGKGDKGWSNLPIPKHTSTVTHFLAPIAFDPDLTVDEKILYRVLHITVQPEQYNLSSVQKKAVDGLNAFYRDEYRIDQLYGVEMQPMVDKYLPQIWNMDDPVIVAKRKAQGLVGEDGVLTATGRNIFLGAKRAFQYDKDFTSIAEGYAEGFRLRKDIKSVGDLVRARGAQSARARADQWMLDDFERATTTDVVSLNITDAPQLGKGVYFSTSKSVAEGYAKGRNIFEDVARPRIGTETVGRFVVPKDTKLFHLDTTTDDGLWQQLVRDERFAKVWREEFSSASSTRRNIWDAAKMARIDIQSILEKMGYKGASHPNFEGSKDIAIWDKSILKTSGDGVSIFRGAPASTTRMTKEEIETVKRLVEQKSIFEQNALGRQVNQLVTASRLTKFGLDFGIVFVQIKSGAIPTLAEHPIQGLGKLITAFSAGVHPSIYRDWVIGNADRIAYYRRAQLTGAKGALERPAVKPLVERIPGIGPIIYHLNEAQFGRILEMTKVEFASLHQQALQKGGGFWSLLGRKALPEGEAARVAASRANATFGGLSLAKLTESADRRDFIRAVVATPDWVKGQIDTFVKAVSSNTPEGVEARIFMVKTAAIWGAFGEAITFATTGRHMNVTNPYSPDWFVASIGDTKVRVLGPMEPIIKTALAPWDKLGKFALGRASGPLGAIIGNVRGRTYLEEPIRTKEGLIGLGQQVGFAAQQIFAPITSASIIHDILKDQMTSLNAVGTMLGANVWTQSEQQKAVLTELVNEALALRVDKQSVLALSNLGKNPLMVVGEDGRRILTDKQRDDIYARVSSRTGIDEKMVRMAGREEQQLTQREKEIELQSRTKYFFDQSAAITDTKRKRFEEIDAAVLSGLPLPTAREQIQNAREAARSNRWQLGANYKDVIDNVLKSPDRLRQRAAKDVLFDSISETLYGPGIVRSDGSVDYDLQEKVTTALVADLDSRGHNGKELMKEFFSNFDNDAPQIVKDYNTAQFILKPYWELPRTLLSTEQYKVYNEYLNIPDALHRQGYKIKHPEVVGYEAYVNAARRSVRIASRAIDQTLVDWYGYRPIFLQGLSR